MQSNFGVELTSQGRANLITVSGELDLASAPELDQALERAFGSNAELVIIDLRALEFMDSTGLSVLVKAHQQAEHAGRQLRFVKGPPQVERLFSLTGVSERLALVDTPEEALRSE